MTLQSDESMMSSIIVIQFMFLGINMFWALHLRGHFNPRLAARAEVCVSLNWTLNTDMPANKESIVLLAPWLIYIGLVCRSRA